MKNLLQETRPIIGCPQLPRRTAGQQLICICLIFSCQSIKNVLLYLILKEPLGVRKAISLSNKVKIKANGNPLTILLFSKAL